MWIFEKLELSGLRLIRAIEGLGVELASLRGALGDMQAELKECRTGYPLAIIIEGSRLEPGVDAGSAERLPFRTGTVVYVEDWGETLDLTYAPRGQLRDLKVRLVTLREDEIWTFEVLHGNEIVAEGVREFYLQSADPSRILEFRLSAMPNPAGWSS